MSDRPTKQDGDDGGGGVVSDSKRKRYWCSWVCTSDDNRPVSYPPNASVIGWWCSGFTSEDHSTLCAVIDADSEDAVRDAIAQDWPEYDGKFRFIEEQDEDYQPGDRFPLSDWMQDRFTP